MEKMKTIFEAVKCNDCKFILDSPVNLPCGKSICSKHSIGKKFYYCRPCGYDHIVPITGYPSNNAIDVLINLTLPEYKRVEKACQSFNSVINELANIKDEPKNQIEKVIDGLKAQIRLSRNALIDEIKSKSEKILFDLDFYRVKCVNSLNGNLSLIKNVEARVENKKNKRESLFDEFRNLNSEPNWKSILERCEKETAQLVDEIEKVKNDLLLNRLDDYKKMKNKFCQLQLLNANEMLVFNLKLEKKFNFILNFNLHQSFLLALNFINSVM